MPKKIIQFLSRVIFVSVPGFVLAIVFMEVVFRIFGYTPYYLNAKAFEPSQVADMVYELRPGFEGPYASAPISINALGFRGHETADEIGRSGLRIAVVGDSVAFGQGVRDGETLSSQLAARLRRRLSMDIAVVNLGVPGYDTCQEYGMFRERAVPLKPQDALLIYVDNDTDPPWIQVRDGAMVIPDTRPGFVGDTVAALRKSSDSFNFLFTHWQVVKGQHITVDQYREMLARKFNDGNPGWRRSRGCLHSFVALAKERSIRVMVIPFPELLGVKESPYPFAGYVRTVCEAARADGAACVDVVPALEHPTYPLRVSGVEHHPSAEVYRRIAEFLAPMLP
jgi:GDSL-like lipase/acylhydrolase family protein